MKIPVAEIFLPIPSYEGLYEISNYGIVKRLPAIIHLKNNTKRLQPGKIKQPTKRNYLSVYLYKEGIGKEYLVHRLVAITFIPNPLNLPQVNHKDGNKFNNRVDNLEWCTPFQNTHHAMNTGLRDTHGENNPAAVLTEEIAMNIKYLKNCGYSFKYIRNKYSIFKYDTLYDCYHDRTWNFVKEMM